MVWGSEFVEANISRIQSVESVARVQGSGFKVRGFGFRVLSSGLLCGNYL